MEVNVAALLILDFDGTMTDAEAEGTPYREGYLGDLAIPPGSPYPRSMPSPRGSRQRSQRSRVGSDGTSTVESSLRQEWIRT